METLRILPMKLKSMRTKLMSVTLGTVIVCMALFMVMAYQSSQALIAGKQQMAKTTAKAIMDKIDRNLFERYGDVQAFALSEPARSMNPKRISDFISDMMPAYAPNYDLMMVVDIKGRLVAANVSDKAGQPIDTSALRGRNFSEVEWFKSAVSGETKAGEAIVQDMHIDADLAKNLNSNGKVMTFTAPIKDKSTGKILGVWTNHMSWNDVVGTIVNDELKQIKSDSISQAFIYIVDHLGTYILHPKGEENELKQKMDEIALGGKPGEFHVLSRKVPSTGYEGTLIEAVISSAGYSSYLGKGWKISVQVPQADPQSRRNVVLIISAALLQFFGAFLAFMTIRGIVGQLLKVNRDLKNDAHNVKGSAVTIESASQSLAQAATEQASALQETAASIEQISAMVKRSAENAQKSSKVASESQEIAQKGKHAVEQMVDAMDEIKISYGDIMRQIEMSNMQISDISKVITEIGSKTNVINEIVFQTKLLSFNASVEAARAGENGKGFAVVAQEVGKLAQMSGSAAKEITDMLSVSNQKVESIVTETRSKVEKLMAEGRTKTEAAILVSNECGRILEEIVRNVAEVSGMVTDISTGTSEQALGISEITKAMNQLDQVTHENANSSQSAANSSTQLSLQAEALFGAVSSLQLILLGNASPETAVSNKIATSKGSMTKSEQLSVKASEPRPVAHAKHAMKVAPSKKGVAIRNSQELKVAPIESQGEGLKRASGGEFIPSADDPRFKDM